MTLHRLGGGLLIPEDDAWPAALADLGEEAPLGLWFRGSGTLPPADRMLAVVGSREATAYGRTVTARCAAHPAATCQRRVGDPVIPNSAPLVRCAPVCTVRDGSNGSRADVLVRSSR